MFTISAALFAVIVVVDLLTPVPPRERLRSLRQEVAAFRAAADSCRSSLAEEEARLLADAARLDSLRGAIDYYEGLHPAGVPADSYDVYLEAFDSFNSGVPIQTAARESLQFHWKGCRSIVERHNQIADSARAIAEELGLLEGSTLRQPTP